VAFVTGHLDPDKPEDEAGIDYEGLARFPGTLVFYMGVRALPEIAKGLIEAGRDASEPAAVIERGTLPSQRTVAAPLGELPAAAAAEEIKPPAITLVGPVAARREAIAWFERRPLHGTRVVVTRARPQASELSRRLAALGADPIELPAIRIESKVDTAEVRAAAEGIAGYDLLCLTSVNAAELLFEAMAAAGRDARALAGTTVAAIGPGTAAALAKVGIVADVVPERSIAESLVEALAGTDVRGKRALVARAAQAREVLPDALRERGAQVDVVTLSETVPAAPEPDALERAAGAGYVTFTSASTVRNLVAALDGKLPPGARIASIGPVTSEAAREADLEVHVEAERHDLDGLVEALLDDASG
jgi:uroporphyrinogen III methyltransferase/synthase